jgi:glycosyltransferase involved in cell wall biosynthesis
MKTELLISVIMPVYNCASYVEEAVNSILNQTFTNFELIIIDDASTDNTVAVVKTFTDSRIKLISKKINQGVSRAVNDGFRLAKGKYIARMDGDDISLKNRFEKQVAILENNSKIFICASWIQFFGNDSKITKYKETHNEIITQLLIHCPISVSSSMFRRKELSNYFYDENKKSGEDYDFWTKVAWLGEMYTIQEVLLLYRVHSKQASIKYKQQQIIDDVEIKLFLFKKINYDTIRYTDNLISKMLLLNQYIEVKELDLFLKWLKELVLLNRNSKVYPQKELENVLENIKKALLFALYFKITAIGVNKYWRFKALLKLDIQDAVYILQLKSSELRKRIVKLK